MSLISRIFRRRSAGVVSGSYVVEAEMHRAEELRSWVRDAPSEPELNDAPHDPWRPSRTLGPMTKP